ncbi:hypothetical protein KAW48_02695 [candidate division WOR-3 bacterium]|nr:hypothetical protein [candidate division WOR-3 bacterium]
MPKVRNVVFFIVVVISVSLTSCLKSDIEFEYFKVRVDGLNVPSSISHEDTLNIQLYGTIGSDGCHSFSHFEAERDTFELKLAVWGKRDIKVGACPCIMVPLDTVYSVFPLYPGSFYIEIQQPDGSTLNDTVNIE